MDANQREAENEDRPGDVQSDLVRHSQSQSILMADAREAQKHYFMIAKEFARLVEAEVSSILGDRNKIVNDKPAMLLSVEQQVEKVSVLQQLDERFKVLQTLVAIKKDELDAKKLELGAQMPNAALPILHMHESGLTIHIGNGNWVPTEEWERASNSEKINRMYHANLKEGQKN